MAPTGPAMNPLRGAGPGFARDAEPQNSAWQRLCALWPLVWSEWRHHPWRHGVAALSVALGVALAWSVHVINDSALAEFASAVRSANGEPDAQLRGPREGFDDALFDTVAAHPAVRHASPVLEIETQALGARVPNQAAASASGERVPLRLWGIDALLVAPLAPNLLPRPSQEAAAAGRSAWLDPERVFLNASARQRLGVADGARLSVQQGAAWRSLLVSGSVAVSGPPLLVMDIAGAQALFQRPGRITRLDLQWQPGADPQTLLSQLPAGVQAVPLDEAEQRLSNLSRAYRVNLTVLALVALLVGGFLVFSVLSLSVAQRTPQWALLGVLGMAGRSRLQLVLLECGALGAVGSLLGLALGTGLAAAALVWLAGDLGGGLFQGLAPQLHWNAGAALGFGLLGLAAALAGGWLPAQQVQHLNAAAALKGLGEAQPGATRARRAGGLPPWSSAGVGLALLLAGGLLALLPPVAGLPLAAYAAVAALLFGGVALVPWVLQVLLRALAHLGPPRSALPLLALERVRFAPRNAQASIAGIVASLALCVALTVMVSSFRQGVTQWLDSVLPADLYVRSAAPAALSDQTWLDPTWLAQLPTTPGVRQVLTTRSRSLALQAGQPAVTLLARDLGSDPAASLPLVGPALLAEAGETGVFVSEALVALYGLKPGMRWEMPMPLASPLPSAASRTVPVRILGVWRDFARQFGSVVMPLADYQRLTGDLRINDVALWLAPGAQLPAVQTALRQAAPEPDLLEFASTADIRRLSLQIFDRSFAVTYYLQAVAIGIGLVGIAAGLSAQVLARRKEFGLLVHLGFTRRQVLALVAGETALSLIAACAVGLLLGLAISAVLVHVVNPQSFHWSMDLVAPLPRLAALCAAVWVAGVAMSAFSARAALAQSALLSVKEE